MNSILSKIYSLLLAIILFSPIAHAGNFSYIYIQGDKKVPFYVKLEDEMLPRYSKNYCIIPQLAPGPVKLQILFQQNQYPPQAFTIQVPENGHRGFLLTMKDNAFALYDVEQKFYLLPGDLGEDHLPEMITTPIAKNKVSINAPQEEKTSKQTTIDKTKPQNNNEPQFIDNIELANNHNLNTPPPTQEVAPQQPQSPVQPIYEQPVYQEPQPAQQPVNIANEPAVGEQPIYQPPPQQPINDINNNLANEQTTAAPPTQPEFDPVHQEPEPAIDNNLPAIINTQCPSSIDDKEFSNIYASTKEKIGDDKRITYLMKQAGSKCFSTRQVFLLSRELDAEAMRYSFLKKVFQRVTDQQNFPVMEDALFKTLEWKSYFRLIYQP